MSDLQEALTKTLTHLKTAFKKPRDPDRIPLIMKQLEEIWRQFPDLRLGQILISAIGDKDLFNIEDKDLIAQVEEWVEMMTE